MSEKEERVKAENERMKRGETLRKGVFILLQGHEILDTNYSCACPTSHLMSRVHLYLQDNINSGKNALSYSHAV